MDYQPPHLCIRSITPVPSRPGFVIVDMPSVYDSDYSVPHLFEFSEDLIPLLQGDPYPVVMCPPGWPITAQ